MRRRVLLVPTLVAAMLLGPIGCGYNSFDKPIRLTPGETGRAEVVHEVEKSGVYFTAVRPQVGHILPWRALEVAAVEGDELGLFEREGTIYALIGDREVELGTPPDGVLYVCWATNEYRMGISRRPGDAVLGGLQVVGVGVLALGVVGLWLAVELSEDDDEDEWRR